MIKVYIASPYTGDEEKNTKRQMDVADEIITCGMAPFAPLLNHYLHKNKPHNYEIWMKLDLEWLKQCDCVLRLSGESVGADREVKFAKENNIPVFYSLSEVLLFNW